MTGGLKGILGKRSPTTIQYESEKDIYEIRRNLGTLVDRDVDSCVGSVSLPSKGTGDGVIGVGLVVAISSGQVRRTVGSQRSVSRLVTAVILVVFLLLGGPRTELLVVGFRLNELIDHDYRNFSLEVVFKVLRLAIDSLGLISEEGQGIPNHFVSVVAKNRPDSGEIG